MLRQNHLAGQLHQSVHVWLESSKVVTHADQVEVVDDHKIAWKEFVHSPSPNIQIGHKPFMVEITILEASGVSRILISPFV